MDQLRHKLATVLLASLITAAGTAYAEDDDDDAKMLKVTITNITQGEIFTPILVASHKSGVKLFKLGSAVSAELEILAEGGNTQPLSDMLKASGSVLDVVTAGGVLPPGQSVTLTVKTNEKNDHVSVVSMLVPTNDAFFAVNGIRGPKRGKTSTVYSPAYDAGSELNDELCAFIPGPPFICTGEGANPNSGEGYVHIHPGIHGIGDLSASAHDWRNPVAKITIKATK